MLLKGSIAPLNCRSLTVAVMAQRKGELLKLGILEKLAGLQKDAEVALENLE